MSHAFRLTEAEYADLLRRRAGGTKTGQPVASSARPDGRAAEDELAAQLDAAVIPHQREYRFLEQRKFRFDVVLLPLCLRLAVEIDGQVHRIDSRFKSDREKFNLALTAGWRVLHVGREQIRSGEALKLIREALQLPAIRTLQPSA